MTDVSPPAAPAWPAHAARLLDCPAYAQYDFGPDHPLTPRRLRVGLDLLRAAGLLAADDVLCSPAATDAELELVHTRQYVEALRRLSDWAPLTEAPLEAEARRYGLGRGDCPVFPGAHAATAAIAGGSLWAVRRLLETPREGATGTGDPPGALHYFHPMGGLHHALPARASGFCLYNDPAVAIAAAVREREARVLYVDLDVHHGDGVQHAFEDEPRVMTVSFHESGEHLFPGTGDVLELGRGAARGTSVNVPLAPGTGDEAYVSALDAILPALAERFRPDLLVTQQGCDTHALDPLADLQLTTGALAHASRLLHRLAHEHCAGRWLACGGGGYDVYRVVPRSWALLWSEMSGRMLPDAVPEAWRRRWREGAPDRLPERFRDDPLPPSDAGSRAAERNRATVARVRSLLLPPLQRLAHPSAPARELPLLRPGAPSEAVPGVVRLTGAMPVTRSAEVESSRGRVLLRDWCPPSLVERLRADEGLVAFTRDSVREKALLARVAAHPDTCLCLAHTPDGVIVGQVTVCAPEGRWAALDGAFELGFEVSRGWRGQGVAQALLRFATAAPWVEHAILVAEGYAWHWDMEDSGLDAFGCRDALVRLLGRVGFSPERTDEPDIISSPANVFLARIGREVSQGRREAFRRRLIRGAYQEKP